MRFVNNIGILAALCFSMSHNIHAIPAFPGAEGGGAGAIGGRGGQIIEVTNLNDAGTGSLRAAIEASGPRIVVFRVGGTISLSSSLRIYNPNITIAGQTAPGGGICLDGRKLGALVLAFHTHDIVVRYLRVRKGYNTSLNSDSQKGQTIAWRDNANKIIVDHVSATWTQDENITIWADVTTAASAPHDITLSWSLIAEPLSAHPTNIITGSNNKVESNAQTDIDFLRNYIANSSHRNPLLKNKSGRIINNLVYNYSFYALQIGGGGSFDIIGNLYTAGPLNPSAVHEMQVFPNGSQECADGTTSLYVVGNKGPHNTDPSADNWGSMIRQIGGENQSESGNLSTSYKRTSALAAPVNGAPVTVESVVGLDTRILSTVGASQRLDSLGNWVMNRDAVDARIVNEYTTKGGIVPDNETQVGGFPVLASGTPYVDNDHDGMSDAWESAKFGTLTKTAIGDEDSDGYTNVEEFLNGTNPNGTTSIHYGKSNLQHAVAGAARRVSRYSLNGTVLQTVKKTLRGLVHGIVIEQQTTTQHTGTVRRVISEASTK
jgi:hypothetical protein